MTPLRSKRTFGKIIRELRLKNTQYSLSKSALDLRTVAIVECLAVPTDNRGQFQIIRKFMGFTCLLDELMKLTLSWIARWFTGGGDISVPHRDFEPFISMDGV